MGYRPAISRPPDSPAPFRHWEGRRRRLARIKHELLDEDPHCYYCGVRLTAASATLDHALPRSKGGRDDKSNLCLACEPCNNDKGDKVIVLRRTSP
jgi:5-methylcytosine-specific restriction endonuclease McrA